VAPVLNIFVQETLHLAIHLAVFHNSSFVLIVTYPFPHIMPAMNNSSTRYVANIQITIRLKFVPFMIDQDQIA
jgi:hypothetical protein